MRAINRKSSSSPASASAAAKKTTSGAVRKATPQHVRREQTEAAILTSAETLFVNNGYHRTTVDAIAAAAGLTKGAVYVRFKDKRDVLLVLLRRAEDRVLVPILKRLGNPQFSLADKMVDYVHSWARVAIEQRNTMFLPILMSFEFQGTKDPIERVINAMYQRTYKVLAEVIIGSGTELAQTTEDSAIETAAVLVAFMDGLLLEWLRRGETVDGEKLTRVARQMILSGLVAPVGSNRSKRTIAKASNSRSK